MDWMMSISAKCDSVSVPLPHSRHGAWMDVVPRPQFTPSVKIVITSFKVTPAGLEYAFSVMSSAPLQICPIDQSLSNDIHSLNRIINIPIQSKYVNP